MSERIKSVPNNCGICIETDNEKEITNRLLQVINNMDNYQNYVSNAWNILHTFSKETVHEKIKEFLQLCIHNTSVKNTSIDSVSLNISNL